MSYLRVINPTEACPEFDTLKLPCAYTFPLDPFQKHAICAIEKGENVLVTAKTGSGKTLVGEHLIANMLAKGKRVFYTTPIKSLSNQKFHDLKQMYDSVGILTGDIKYRPDAQILIMTTEILRNLLYKKNTATHAIGTTSLISMENLGGVVFDECHYINDPDRGKVWEETLILLDPSIQLVLLSATIDRAEHFAGWLGNLKKVPIHLISTTYRIVPLLHQVMLGQQPQLLMDNKEFFQGEAYTRWLQWRDQKRRDARNHQTAVATRRAGGFEDPVVKGANGLASYQHQMNSMIEYLGDKSLLPALFFVFSRKDCEEFAAKVQHSLLTSSESASVKHIWNFHLHRHKEQIETLPQAHTLLSLLEKGIAFHHSGLLPILREMVEILFGKGLIKVLFATETFAVGINMPTKTVVFTDVNKYSDEVQGIRRLRTDEYIQMAGRAGRRGKDTEGHVFYLPMRDPINQQEMKDMMTGKRTPITSRMDFHYEFLLKTLQNPFLNWTDVFKTSYWKVQREEALQVLMNDMLKLKKEMNALGLTEEQLGECIDRVNLEYSVKRCVNAEKRKAQAALETWKNKHMGPVWDSLWKKYQTFKELDEKWASLRDSYEGLDKPEQDIDQKLRFLVETEYISENFQPTLRGILATEVNEGHALLLSYAFEKKLCHSFSPEELVCFLAGFLGKEADKKMENVALDDLAISDEVREALYKVDDYTRDLIAIEKRMRLTSPDDYWNLSSAWIDICRRWFQGEDAATLCAEYGIYMGNFIRGMLKLGNLVEEWINMATYCEHVELLERYKDMKDMLVRGLAKPQSLYLLL
jgi:superfamily II RNA helicase